MNRTVLINKGHAMVIVYDVPKNKQDEARRIFFSSLKQLEKILVVRASVVHAELKKENSLTGTPAGNLKAYRDREGLTQAELAQNANIPQGHISAMERGKRVVGIKIAKKLAKVLNCRWEKLVT